MAESLGEAVLDLRADNRRFNREIDASERKAQGLARTFTKVGTSLSSFGRTMTVGVTLPLVAAGAAAFKLAADAEEAGSKFEVVMGGSADAVRARLKALEATIPLTTGEFLGLAAGVQDLLVPLGLAREAGAEMSATFVEIAGDIAAFNDTSPAQVLDDIRSGLVGSSEPLFKYGVDTRVAALETVAFNAGLIEEGEKLTDVARAQAVLLQIQAQTTDATGTAAAEVENSAAQTRFLVRDIKQLGEEIGATLLPVITPMISKVRDWVNWFRQLSPETQGMIVKAGLLAAALGPVLFIFGKLVSVGGTLIGVLTTNTVTTVANTAATVANAAATTAGGAARGVATGLITTQTGALAANTAATTGATAASSRLGLSMAGKAGLVGAVGIASFALTRFIDKQIGLTDAIERTGFSLSGILDKLGLYGESTAEIAAGLLEDTAASRAFAEATESAGERLLRITPIMQTFTGFLEEQRAAAKAAAVAHKEKLADAISGLGLAIKDDALGTLKDLNLVIDEGIVPVEQLAPLVVDLQESWKEMGLLSPEIIALLEEINGKIREQGGIIEELLGPAIVGAAETTGVWADVMGGMPGIIEDVGGELKFLQERFGLTAVEAMAVANSSATMADMMEQAAALAGELGPEIEALARKQLGLARATEEGTNSLSGFFKNILGGIPGLGMFSEALDSVTNKLGEWAGQLKGFLSDKLSGLFSKDSKIGTFLSDGLGKAIGIAIPFIGPLIAPFIGKIAGLLGKGLKAIGGKIAGVFKGLFGGPGAAELEARKIADSFDPIFESLLTTQQLTEAGGELWKKNNIAQRDIIIALGGSVQDVEGIWARFQDRAKNPEAANAFKAFWDEKLTAVQALMAETGLSLEDLKKKAESTAKEAAEAIVVTEEEKNAALKVLAELQLADMMGSLDEQQKAQRVAAATTVKVWKDAQDTIASNASTTATKITESMGRAVRDISGTFEDLRFEIPVGFDFGDLPKLSLVDAPNFGGFDPIGTGQTRPGQFRRIPGSRNQPVPIIGHGDEIIGRLGDGGGETIVVHNHIHLGDREIGMSVLKMTRRLRGELGID